MSRAGKPAATPVKVGLLWAWLTLGLTALAAGEDRFIPVEGLRLPEDLKLLNIHDQVTDIGSLQRPLLINLWASWCAPCLEELPSLNRLRQTLPEVQLAMVALNYGDSLLAVRRYTQDYPIEFEVLLDLTTLYSQRLEPLGLPTTYLVDPSGQVRYRFEGKADWSSEAMLEKLRAALATMSTRGN